LGTNELIPHSVPAKIADSPSNRTKFILDIDVICINEVGLRMTEAWWVLVTRKS
jgi:hypothetical protein